MGDSTLGRSRREGSQECHQFDGVVILQNNPFKSEDERKLVLYSDLLLSACCEEA